MIRLAACLFGLLLSACGGGEPSASQTAPSGRNVPKRIVSLDYCADQYVLKLADADQILAVSPDAVRDYSYMRETAEDFPTVRPRSEDVLVLQPDLVVRTYGGGPNATALFERAGIPVLQIGFPTELAGDGEGSVARVVIDAAAGLGHPSRGDRLAAQYLARLEELASGARKGSIFYMTPAGVTTGPGSLIHEMFLAAGFDNHETRPGWRPLPLEELVYRPPVLIAAAFYGTNNSHPDSWSASRHPVAQKLLDSTPVIGLDAASVSCGGWFLIDAVETLAEGAGR